MPTISTPVIPLEVSNFLNGIPPFIYAFIVTAGVAMAIGIGVYYRDLKLRKADKSNLGCY